MIDKPWHIPEDAITDWSANPLAAGGFGEVFKASYYGAPVAVKQLYRGYNQNELADFGREIGIWHRLSHPHVLPLLGACDTTTKPFMVSPFMPNGTLHNHLATAPEPRPLSEKVRLLYQVASGMAYLHGNNIVHGDLKSLNVLLDESYHAVVTDFGMSRTKHTSATANRTRRDQPAGGTLDYMAPEMLDYDDPVGSSKATDVYAFGITMYEVLNNCRPIWVTADGQPMRERVIESQVLRGNRPKQFDDIPDSIRALIERCWHQDPAMRPRFPEILAILRQSTVLFPAQDGEQRPIIVTHRRLESFQPIQEVSAPRVSFPEPLTPRTPPAAAVLTSKPVPVKNLADALQLLNFGGDADFDSDEEDDEFDLWFAVANGNDSASYQRAFTNVYAQSRHQQQLPLFISAIAISQSPLTIRMIADLFGVDIRIVRRCIKELGPVLDPGKLSRDKQGSSAAKAQKHKSIAAYLIGVESVNEPFHVSSKFHMAFASQCLLSILSHEPVINICDIYDFHDNIPDLEDLVRAKITPSLRYSVAHWITHFVWCTSNEVFDRQIWKQYRASGLGDSLSQFLASHVFFWLEAGSLIGVIPELTTQLHALEEVLEMAPNTAFDDATKELVKDTYRFICEFADPISESAPQVYNSGYAFTPKETAIYKTYADQLEDKIPFLVTARVKGEGADTNRSTEGHGTVVARTTTRDDKTIVLVEFDGTIKHLDANSGEIKRTFTDHKGDIRCSAVSSDGKFVACRDNLNSNTIKVWNTTHFSLKHTLTGHTNRVLSVSISPNCLWIVSGSEDKSVKMWNATTGQLIHTLEGHTSYVHSVAIAPDSKWIATGSADNTIKVWDATTGRLRRTLKGHTSYVYSVAISPDGKWIASGSYDRTIKLWDATTGHVKRTLEGHTGWVSCVAISPDGKCIVSGSGDKTIRVWDASTGQTKQTLTGHTYYVGLVVFSPDANSISSRNWNPGLGQPSTREEFVWVRQGDQWVRSSNRTANLVPTPTRPTRLTPSEWFEIEDRFQWIRHGPHAIKLPLSLGPPSDAIVSHILPIYLNTPKVMIAFANYLSNSPDPKTQARAAAVHSGPVLSAYYEEQERRAEEARRADEVRRAEETRRAEQERKAKEAKKAERAAKLGKITKFFL